VGNITAGGTGKTPLVAWLARLLLIRKRRPAILSRGYGRHEALGLDDENAMLAHMVPGVPVVVDPDRVRGASRAVREHRVDVLVLDDGFQHRRLARDLDLVLIDGVWPFGASHLLPRGLLREPLSALRRADFVLMTRANLIAPERIEHVKKRLGEVAPGVPTACCATTIEGIRPLGAREAEPSARLREGRWWAFCGVGNPEGFRLTLALAGCRPVGLSVFSDHHRYREAQVRGLLERARQAGCQGLVTTEKDAVKVEGMLERRLDPPVYVLQTDLEFTEGSERLCAAIAEAVS
jgi:tetraacyldisaccharide 4'-kinase